MFQGETVTKKEWVDISEAHDGKVMKCTLRTGKGARPRRCQKVAIHYTMSLENGPKVYSTRDEGKPFDFTIGSCEIPAFNAAALNMVGGERAELKIDSSMGYGEAGHPPTVPPNANLFVELDLLYILEDMPKEEAIKQAEEVNKRAGEAYRNEKYEEASVLYHECCQILQCHTGDDLDLLFDKYRSNLSTVYSKLGKWGESMHNAERILQKDKTNQRCILRKLDALIHLGRLEEAEEYLKKGLELSNNDPVFSSRTKDIEKARAEMKSAQENVYKKMAGKKFF